MKLGDAIDGLDSYSNDEHTIYAVEPWTWDSIAIVAEETNEGKPPPEALEVGASYFLEIFIAREFLEGWRTNNKHSTLRQDVDRLISYAINDA